ncbi:retrovirus-related pol polyprotein from transposon TNT 1-94 [Tanacetum coccineum]
MVEEVTSLKKDFKQKENKYLEEFLDMKALKEKVEDKLYKQDQSLQTVHMLCKPKPYYDEQRKVAIGYKNPLCLTRAKQVQPALYNGHEIIKTHHVPTIVHNSEDTLEIAKITRKKMNDKMKTPLWTEQNINIRPPDYSKENYLATFTPQTQLTPRQIFWSKDVLKMKAKALKEQTTTSRPIKALMVYPPNTPATLSPGITPTGLTEGERGFEQTKECYLTEVIPFFKTLKEHFKGKALTKEIKEMKEIFEELEAEVDQNVVNRKFTEMHDAHIVVQACCLELEAEIYKLHDKIQKDDHNELVKCFSNLETTTLLTENENMKAQIHENLKCITMDSVKPEVLSPGRYVIDIEPIPPHSRNNREVHLYYLKHLKESVETLCEIVEEAKVEKPLDRSLASACLYTKHSQELLEYVIGTCPKDFNKQDKKHASTPLTRKKQVTFEDNCETSNNNIHKHVEQLNIQKTNVYVIPSTGVNSCTDASGSKPRSNTKKNMISPDKSVNKKKVEEHPRINKFSLKTTNRVNYSIRSKLASRKHSCYVRDTDGVELIKGSHDFNLYTISVDDMMKSSPICLLSKASKNKLWLRHRRLNHLNFGTINDLARIDLVRGLPRLKFEKDHLCSACQLGKSKKHTHKPKTENSNLGVLNTLHMDLCRLMRVQTINGKKYILVIVDDYSRFTWVKFLRSKDETPEFVIKFLKQIQVGLNKTIRYIRIDNGTEFVNKDLTAYYERVSIFHQKTVLRTLQENGVAERRNRTLLEAARTMLIFSKAPIEDLGKLQTIADIGIFVGYAPSRKGYRIYNKRTQRIMETIHVQFNELTEHMAPVQLSTGPAPIFLMPG